MIENMAVSLSSFEDLMCHVGHKIVITTYGKDTDVWNVAIECETCNEVLLDYDNPEHEYEEES